MSTSNIKGKELEDSVRLIEEAVLKANPSFATSTLEITCREHFIRAGTRREVDVAVRINKGGPYSSLHIFECKNWKKPAGKNVVVILADTVDAIGASHGYVVARSFTRDAIALANINPRITLVECSDSITTPLDFIQPCVTTTDFLDLEIQIRRSSDAERQGALLYLKRQAICYYEQRVVSLASLATADAEEQLQTELGKEATWQRLPGAHTLRLSRQRSFRVGEFSIDGFEIDRIRVSATYVVYIRLPTICSKFEIVGRGRHYHYAAAAAHGLPAVSINVVQPTWKPNSAGG